MSERHYTKDEIREQNARISATGVWSRWIYKRYQRVDLIEMARLDAADPIGLRKIFVPLRLGEESVRDEEMIQKPDDSGDVMEPEEEKEHLRGRDAWDVLVERPWAMISGLPGSGKSTLVQAVIMETCGEHPSDFRWELKAMPVPFILRRLGDLRGVRTFEDLLERWWPEQLDQAEADGMPLDKLRLEASLFPEDLETLRFPVILLFDGIDEVGGKEARQRILEIAWKQHSRGYRVVVTGRPNGFEELELPTIMMQQPETGFFEEPPEARLLHVLPFAWPQIETFITRWYDLRDDWKRDSKAGVERFLDHLAHSERKQLLALARRPIFLTLMALVNCVDHVMPEGRALLYRRIVELYLERQRQHRRIKTIEGKEMPDWPETETRLVLGHLAWLSQLRGSEEKTDDPDNRRVVWKREEVEEIFRSQLSSKKFGRFQYLKPDDASELVKYFIHPAGLLVEPAEGELQIAHLSFQEFLCADFLHQRSKVSSRNYLRVELFEKLGRPGWDEVGMLLLCINAQETSNEGHFSLLNELDLTDLPQAKLFVSALAGGELPFQLEERLAWLPVGIAGALLHPWQGLGTFLGRFEEWQAYGRELLLQLLEDRDPNAMWMRLISKAGEEPEWDDQHEMRATWSEMKKPAREHVVLEIIADCGWTTRNDIRRPIEDEKFETLLATWLPELWRRDEENKPLPSDALFELERILPDCGPLWATTTEQTPIDAVILQGEVAVAQPLILLILQPSQILDARPALATAFYKSLMLTESTAQGRNFDGHFTTQTLASTFTLTQEQTLAHLMQPLSLDRSQLLGQTRTLPRSLAWTLAQSREMMQMPLQSHSLAQILVETQLEAQALTAAAIPSLIDFDSQLVRHIERITADKAVFVEIYQRLLVPIIQAGLRHAALDYFQELAETPDLRKNHRQPAEGPLPAKFNLFDEHGIPNKTQKRTNWLQLRTWLENPDNILTWLFPEGTEKEALLREDIDILYSQPWSPLRGIDAMLEDWPEDQEEREITMEAAERRVAAAVEEILAEIDA